MGACCGRNGKKAKAKAAARAIGGQVEFSSEKPPIQGRCSTCGAAGGYAKRFHKGVRVRVFACTNGHVLPAA